MVAALTGVELTVAFCGFAPGFGYLTGLPEELHVPRRATPRTRVPAGSVALAGPYAGVYPQASPGGWQLVGRTDAVLFDVDRDPPALLAPRDAGALPGRRLSAHRARHRAAGHRPGPRPARLRRHRGAAVGRRRRGRRGSGRTGWSATTTPAATLEVTAGGLRVRAERTVLVAVTGAPGAGHGRRPARRPSGRR